jgi:hypothetical protein
MDGRRREETSPPLENNTKACRGLALSQQKKTPESSLDE